MQRFSRRLAQFFADVDLFLTPTMSSPPVPIGTMVSTPEDPWHAMHVSAPTVRYAAVVANLTRPTDTGTKKALARILRTVRASE